MYNVGLAWFAGPGREGIDHIGRIPSFLLLRNFEGDERGYRRKRGALDGVSWV